MEPYHHAGVLRSRRMPRVHDTSAREGAMSKINIGIAALVLVTVLSAAGYAVAKGGGGGHGGGGHGGGGHGGGGHGGSAHFRGGGHGGGHFGGGRHIGGISLARPGFS